MKVSVEITGNELEKDTLATAAANASDNLGDDIIGDVFASSEYRRSVASVHLWQAITAAVVLAG